MTDHIFNARVRAKLENKTCEFQIQFAHYLFMNYRYKWTNNCTSITLIVKVNGTHAIMQFCFSCNRKGGKRNTIIYVFMQPFNEEGIKRIAGRCL